MYIFAVLMLHQRRFYYYIHVSIKEKESLIKLILMTIIFLVCSMLDFQLFSLVFLENLKTKKTEGFRDSHVTVNTANFFA